MIDPDTSPVTQLTDNEAAGIENIPNEVVGDVSA